MADFTSQTLSHTPQVPNRVVDEAHHLRRTPIQLLANRAIVCTKDRPKWPICGTNNSKTLFCELNPEPQTPGSEPDCGRVRGASAPSQPRPYSNFGDLQYEFSRFISQSGRCVVHIIERQLHARCVGGRLRTASWTYLRPRQPSHLLPLSTFGEPRD